MTINTEELQQIYTRAERLFSLDDVEHALDQIIAPITRDLGEKNPVVLGVMNGSLATLGYLLPRLNFLLELDYVHATRYRGNFDGSQLLWKRKPDVVLQGRHVLLVDDLLDQGITLKAVADDCVAQGAASVSIAVLATKKLDGYNAPIQANYSALTIPDRFVFGFGMDYKNYWRNAPGIFACKE